jgi:magnesium chelatase accessory protein
VRAKVARRLDFDTDGRDWPHRAASSFVHADGIRWHVQQMKPPQPDAPVLLLIHGTGAATHSWRGLMSLLARQHHVVAMDLPGHGFTDMPMQWPLSLPRMAQAAEALADTLGVNADVIVGHSAGAAIAARMVLDGLARPRRIVSLNGALLPLAGLAGQLFSPMAKLLAANPIVPRLFAWRAADRRVVERLVDSTGSALDAQGLALYARLVANPGHAAGALSMMANWALEPLQRDLSQLKVPLHLVVGANDRTVPPAQAESVQRLLPAAWRTMLPALGHLAHEERPDLVAPLIEAPSASRKEHDEVVALPALGH